jgi:very-short-patch-repair endonuclease
MWRFDFAWPDLLFAVEVEGITHGEGGRHQRAYGFELDLEKYQAAMLQGWTVYRCSPRLVRSAAALDTIVTMIEAVQQQR